MLEVEFSSTVIRWKNEGAWHFAPLPVEVSREIDRFCGDIKGGWGSVRVEATIGDTTWRTSIFPDSGRKAFLLPLKQAVRRAEDIAAGDEVTVTLSM